MLQALNGWADSTVDACIHFLGFNSFFKSIYCLDATACSVMCFKSKKGKNVIKILLAIMLSIGFLHVVVGIDASATEV